MLIWYVVYNPTQTLLNKEGGGGEEKKKLTNPAPLRLPDSSSKRVLRLHPAPARLALCEPTLHSRNGASHRFERLVRSPGADRGRVDLQE